MSEIKVLGVELRDFLSIKNRGVTEILILFDKDIRKGQKAKVVLSESLPSHKALTVIIEKCIPNYAGSKHIKYLNLFLRRV